MLKTAVLLHISNTVFLGDFKSALEKLPADFDLFINQVTGLQSPDALNEQGDALALAFPKAQIIRSEARGREIGGMFALFSKIIGQDYQAVFFAHSNSNEDWRKKILHTFSEQAGKILLQLGTTKHSAHLEVGMIGAYIRPFDYYNLGPFMELADQLQLPLETSWDNFYTKYPQAENLNIEERARWSVQQQQYEGRPEVDLQYALRALGNFNLAEEKMNSQLEEQFVADSVIGPLPYFPGNFFWLNGKIIDLLASKICFGEEFQKLPSSAKSDPLLQSRTRAWERTLACFVAKNGYRVIGLE